ncbi:hypothetical protein E2562_010682 [Oryza meyeriana var. granulata]|uniref:Uncharacterized protein n=1 Tax=Oryza meyeriana var. granulata TaxID=110450 RepID=A0A6G1EW01_9ORYZ|nr:hypothetical protein E2562_010682 [Oryza meyeriana var. granulata]
MAGLVLSPAAADSPAAAGDDKWVVDLPADAPSATTVVATPGGTTEYDAIAVADSVVAAPATAHRFRPRYGSALSPDAKRALEHEARCGPRVPVRRGFPWPEWKPNCRGNDSKPPAALLRRPGDEP